MDRLTAKRDRVMAEPVVTLFGGTGFAGRYLVQRLARAGCQIRLALRDPDQALFLKSAGDVGQIVPMAADLTRPETLPAVVEGADWVINLAELMSERRTQTFDAVHVKGAGDLARAASEAGASRFIQLSTIGADASSPSTYARSKAAGEEAVLSAFPGATILRPSAMFGAEDRLFNLMAGVARFSWVLPVFGCPLMPRIKLFKDDELIQIDLYGDGGTRVQPVYVGDVAGAAMAALEDDASMGKTYELGGPRVYSSKEMMDILIEAIGRKRYLSPVPFWLFSYYAWWLELLPAPFFSKPLLTRDQVQLMKIDTLVAPNALGLANLGITPVMAEQVVPGYLERFRPSRLSHLRSV